MTWIHYYNSTWSIITVFKILCASHHHRSPLSPTNHWPFYCLQSFTFSRMSNGYNGTGQSFIRLASFTYQYAFQFLPSVFLWFDSSFLFSATKYSISGCTVLYWPIHLPKDILVTSELWQLLIKLHNIWVQTFVWTCFQLLCVRTKIYD